MTIHFQFFVDFYSLIVSKRSFRTIKTVCTYCVIFGDPYALFLHEKQINIWPEKHFGSSFMQSLLLNFKFKFNLITILFQRENLLKIMLLQIKIPARILAIRYDKSLDCYRFERNRSFSTCDRKYVAYMKSYFGQTTTSIKVTLPINQTFTSPFIVVCHKDYE